MARFYFVLGGVLIVAAIAALLVGLNGDEDSAANQIVQRLHCQPNENLQVSTTTQGGKITLFYSCGSSEGQQRDITMLAALTIGAPFVVLLLLGIMAFFLGSRHMTRNLTQQANTYYSQFPTQGGQVSTTVIDLQGQDLSNLPPEKLEKVKQVMSMFNVSPDGNMPSSSLISKLEQLEEARKKGLISDGEYERVRRDILDNMAD